MEIGGAVKRSNRPYVQPHELVFNPERPLTVEQQRGLIVRLEMESRRIGKPVSFPDLQRLPVDPATMVLFAIERRKGAWRPTIAGAAGTTRKRAAAHESRLRALAPADTADTRQRKRLRREIRFAVASWLEPLVRMGQGLWPLRHLPLHQGSWVRYIGTEGQLQQPVAFGTYGQVASNRGHLVLFERLEWPLVVPPDLLELVPAPPPGRCTDHYRRLRRRRKARERTQPDT
jgi:hypothetical protein